MPEKLDFYPKKKEEESKLSVRLLGAANCYFPSFSAVKPKTDGSLWKLHSEKPNTKVENV